MLLLSLNEVWEEVEEGQGLGIGEGEVYFRLDDESEGLTSSPLEQVARETYGTLQSKEGWPNPTSNRQISRRLNEVRVSSLLHTKESVTLYG